MLNFNAQHKKDEKKTKDPSDLKSVKQKPLQENENSSHFGNAATSEGAEGAALLFSKTNFATEANQEPEKKHSSQLSVAAEVKVRPSERSYTSHGHRARRGMSTSASAADRKARMMQQ